MSKDVVVTRLRHPKALEIKEIEELIERAVNASEVFAKWTPAAKEEVSQALGLPSTGIFIGMEEGEFKGAVFATLPTSTLIAFPQVVHYYAGRADRGGASAELRKAMTQAVVDFMAENGYTAFRAICPHTTERKISAWKRLFRKAGEATEVGRIVEFKQ